MRRFLYVLCAIFATYAVTPGLYAQPAQPPVTGAVQNFDALDKPRPVPDTPVRVRDGTMATLERFRGKLVVLNFWATWCGPCIRELPSLNRLNAELAGDDFAVVLISQDRGGFQQTDRFLKKLKVDIPDNFVDEKLAFSRAIGVRSLPTTILIGTDGNELGRIVGHAEWDTPEALDLIAYYRNAGS